ncbi:hypothetical protein LWI28_027707 [Acer negundo]|uniref:Uncharacterized protein n=1 Tax=Acer negundo TaxID=4023 RepID=A0AAD5P4W8_ACENE|nr:hypothetical protein LWI28_027707 [Acer negundo]
MTPHHLPARSSIFLFSKILTEGPIFVLKDSDRGTYFLTLVGAKKLLSQGADPKLKASDIKKLGESVTEDSVTGHPVGVIPRHFMKHITWMNDSQDLLDDAVHRVVRMVACPISERIASVLFAESTLLERRIVSGLPDDHP